MEDKGGRWMHSHIVPAKSRAQYGPVLHDVRLMPWAVCFAMGLQLDASICLMLEWADKAPVTDDNF